MEDERERDCLDRRQGGCYGRVLGRPSRGGTGAIIHRCEAHNIIADQVLQRLRERYPDSSTPPRWFDPTDAGESWDEEY